MELEKTFQILWRRTRQQKYILPSLSRVLVLVFFTNTVFGFQSQETIWKQRKSNNIQLAGLPGSFSPEGFSNLSRPQLQHELLHQIPSIKPALNQIRSEILSNKKNTQPKIVSSLPAELFSHVNIRGFHQSNSKEIVVLLEDVHLNKEAQLHLSSAIKSFGDQKGDGAVLVGLEGAHGKFLYDVYKKFSDRETASLIADSFLDSGEISGPAHAGFTSYNKEGTRGLRFWGVDDDTLYRQNVAAYKDTEALKPHIQKQIAQLTEQGESEKAKVFNSALRQFDSQVKAYRAGKLPMAEFVKVLAKAEATVEVSLNMETFLQAYEMESQINFDLVEQERSAVLEKLVKTLSQKELESLIQYSLAYQEGDVTFAEYYQHLKQICLQSHLDLNQVPHFDSYIRYVLLADGIKTEPLFKEISELEKVVYEDLTETESERALIEESRRLYLMGELINFSMTTDQWQEYSRRGAACCAQKPGNSHLGVACYAPTLKPFESFYVSADARSQAMVNNLLAQPNSDLSILVAGGFHTQALTQLLKEKNISYIVATPKITKIDLGKETHYLSVFDREKTPLQQIFLGKKLFVPAPTVGAGKPAGEIALATLGEMVVLNVASNPTQARALSTANELTANRVTVINENPGTRAEVKVGDNLPVKIYFVDSAAQVTSWLWKVGAVRPWKAGKKAVEMVPGRVLQLITLGKFYYSRLYQWTSGNPGKALALFLLASVSAASWAIGYTSGAIGAMVLSFLAVVPKFSEQREEERGFNLSLPLTIPITNGFRAYASTKRLPLYNGETGLTRRGNLDSGIFLDRLRPRFEKVKQWKVSDNKTVNVFTDFQEEALVLNFEETSEGKKLLAKVVLNLNLENQVMTLDAQGIEPSQTTNIIERLVEELKIGGITPNSFYIDWANATLQWKDSTPQVIQLQPYEDIQKKLAGKKIKRIMWRVAGVSTMIALIALTAYFVPQQIRHLSSAISFYITTGQSVAAAGTIWAMLSFFSHLKNHDDRTNKINRLWWYLGDKENGLKLKVERESKEEAYTFKFYEDTPYIHPANPVATASLQVPFANRPRTRFSLHVNNPKLKSGITRFWLKALAASELLNLGMKSSASFRLPIHPSQKDLPPEKLLEALKHHIDQSFSEAGKILSSKVYSGIVMEIVFRNHGSYNKIEFAIVGENSDSLDIFVSNTESKSVADLSLSTLQFLLENNFAELEDPALIIPQEPIQSRFLLPYQGWGAGLFLPLLFLVAGIAPLLAGSRATFVSSLDSTEKLAFMNPWMLVAALIFAWGLSLVLVQINWEKKPQPPIKGGGSQAGLGGQTSNQNFFSHGGSVGKSKRLRVAWDQTLESAKTNNPKLTVLKKGPEKFFPPIMRKVNKKMGLIVGLSIAAGCLWYSFSSSMGTQNELVPFLALGVKFSYGSLPFKLGRRGQKPVAPKKTVPPAPVNLAPPEESTKNIASKPLCELLIKTLKDRPLSTVLYLAENTYFITHRFKTVKWVRAAEINKLTPWIGGKEKTEFQFEGIGFKYHENFFKEVEWELLLPDGFDNPTKLLRIFLKIVDGERFGKPTFADASFINRLTRLFEGQMTPQELAALAKETTYPGTGRTYGVSVGPTAVKKFEAKLEGPHLKIKVAESFSVAKRAEKIKKWFSKNPMDQHQKRIFEKLVAENLFWQKLNKLKHQILILLGFGLGILSLASWYMGWNGVAGTIAGMAAVGLSFPVSPEGTNSTPDPGVHQIVEALVQLVPVEPMIGHLTANDIRRSQELKNVVSNILEFRHDPAHLQLHIALLKAYLYKVQETGKDQTLEQALNSLPTVERGKGISLRVMSIGQVPEKIEEDTAKANKLIKKLEQEEKERARTALLILFHPGMTLEQRLQVHLNYKVSLSLDLDPDWKLKSNKGLYSYRDILSRACRKQFISEEVETLIKDLLRQKMESAQFITINRIPSEFSVDEKLRAFWIIVTNMGLGWQAFGADYLDRLMKGAELVQEHA